jgi:hydroxymethylbilane synthase
MTRSIDPYDALVSKSGLKLEELPYGSRLGTSSRQRKAGLKKYRNDFDIVDIRGNIGERIEKLYNSRLDGIVIAACGLIRLGLENKITQRIPFEIFKPHPRQGRLAVVARREDSALCNLLSVVQGFALNKVNLS